MSNTLIGFLAVLGIFHGLFIIIPLRATLQAPISAKSKALWSTLIVLLPLVGVAVFHFRFKSSLLLGKKYEPTPHDLGAVNYPPKNRD